MAIRPRVGRMTEHATLTNPVVSSRGLCIQQRLRRGLEAHRFVSTDAGDVTSLGAMPVPPLPGDKRKKKVQGWIIFHIWTELRFQFRLSHILRCATCVCVSSSSRMTCRSSPSTPTHCPCHRLVAGGVSWPLLHLSSRHLSPRPRPAGSCDR